MRTRKAKPDAKDPLPAPARRPIAEASVARVGIPIEARLEGTLVRRYKRFLADVRLPDGREITVHCPNPGRMSGTDAPGSRVRCSTHDDPRRKLRHTLEMIRVGRVWVGLHAARANDIAAAALEAGALSCSNGLRPGGRRGGAAGGPFRIEREVASPDGSRFDFRLCSVDPSPGPDCWIEVKSVTLCAGGRARFPDAVTERGRRHLEHLAGRVRAGERALLLFVAQRADAESVAPADDIDPAYARTLRAVAAAGVELHALGAHVSPSAIRLVRRLPVLL